MRAWMIDKLEGLQHLRLAETPDPTPSSDDLVLRVDYAALNPADRYLAMNQYPAKPALPHILGRDGVGVVESVGANVTQWRPGDPALILRSEIGTNRPGTLAEKVVVPADCLVKIPNGWTAPEAAAAVLVYLTAYQAYMQWETIEPGVTFVSGISGGVGVASIHVGKALGHTVIGTSRDRVKWPRLKELGAAELFDPTDGNWRKSAKAWLGERKVSLAIDNIGGTLLPEMIDLMGLWGKLSIVGRLAGPTPQFNSSSLLFRRLRLGGVALSTWNHDECRVAWDAVVALINKINARPLVDSIHAFNQVPDAFARLEHGPLGKVLVKIGGQ
jgi:NADPH2:quinone reductase